MTSLINLDVNTFLLLNGLSGSAIANSVIIFLAEYLAYILPVIFLIILYRARYSLREKFFISATVFGSAVIARLGVVSIIRFFYHRPRPFLTYHLDPLFMENSFSFPSGHATFFFALAGAIYLYNKKWGAWFFIAAALMSIARVIAGVHYPSDIIGGMIFGVITVYLTFRYLTPSFKKIISRLV